MQLLMIIPLVHPSKTSPLEMFPRLFQKLGRFIDKRGEHHE
jgi:hypothetical protein